MVDIRPLTPEVDLSQCKIRYYDWDVVIRGVPYQVVDIEGYVHTVGGHEDWGDGNSKYCYPRNEEMSVKNLVAFDGERVCWGLKYDAWNYTKTKWGETEVRSSSLITITRNGEPFYDTHGIHKALDLLEYLRANEHPLDLQDYDYDKKCIGRKVWWKGQKAIVSRWVKGQACVILTPDPEIGKFTCPAEWVGDDIMWNEESESELKIDIFSHNVDWFRNR